MIQPYNKLKVEIFNQGGENMNEYIAKYLKNKINETGITYRNVSKKTGIEYQRLMRIFNQNAVISASELITLCNVLGIEPTVFYSAMSQQAAV